MSKENFKKAVSDISDAAEVVREIENMPATVVLRHLAFWLSIALTKGRILEANAMAEREKTQEDVVSQASKDPE